MGCHVPDGAGRRGGFDRITGFAGLTGLFWVAMPRAARGFSRCRAWAGRGTPKIHPCRMADGSLDGAKPGKAPLRLGQTPRFSKPEIPLIAGRVLGGLKRGVAAKHRGRDVRFASGSGHPPSGNWGCFGLPCPGRRGMARGGKLTQSSQSPQRFLGCHAPDGAGCGAVAFAAGSFGV